MTDKLAPYLTGQITALLMRMGRELDAEARTGTPVSSCEAELQRMLQIEVLLSERSATRATWFLGSAVSGFDTEVIYVEAGDQMEVFVTFTYPLRGGEVTARRKFILEKP